MNRKLFKDAAFDCGFVHINLRHYHSCVFTQDLFYYGKCVPSIYL